MPDLTLFAQWLPYQCRVFRFSWLIFRQAKIDGWVDGKVQGKNETTIFSTTHRRVCANHTQAGASIA
jgi:hypothetical protein